MKRSELARLAVLDTAAEELARLSSMSDLIKVEPVRQVEVKGWPSSQLPEGWPAELYRVTYLCNGFTGIREDGTPIVGAFHQMAMYLTKDFPALEPKLAWITPIWHPNIDHAGTRHVCFNASEQHRTLRPLSDLLLYIGEMVQYRQYHAKHEKPWPLDVEVAKWVREVAEPRGWVSPDKPLDERPLLRGVSIRVGATLSPPSVPKIGWGRKAEEIKRVATSSPTLAAPRIEFGKPRRQPGK